MAISLGIYPIFRQTHISSITYASEPQRSKPVGDLGLQSVALGRILADHGEYESESEKKKKWVEYEQIQH